MDDTDFPFFNTSSSSSCERPFVVPLQKILQILLTIQHLPRYEEVRYDTIGTILLHCAPAHLQDSTSLRIGKKPCTAEHRSDAFRTFVESLRHHVHPLHDSIEIAGGQNLIVHHGPPCPSLHEACVPPTPSSHPPACNMSCG